MDTIVAISTPVGSGGIGIVRLSGNPLGIMSKMFKSAELAPAQKPMPKYMYFGEIVTSGFCDKGYMVYFASPKSFTGEDVVEFHLHGGVKIVNGVLAECVKLGARPATRGEFTKRAFLGGKLSLADAEGVIDMINAESEAAVNAAYRLMSGKLSTEVGLLQERLKDAITDLEAVMDYPEELEDEVIPSAKKTIDFLCGELKTKLDYRAYGRLVKHGINIAIIGKPNAGKSALLNAVLGADRAIVSDVMGTTRDTVSDRIECNGIMLNFSDTAGIRETEELIEKEGVNRAKTAALNADLVLYVQDSTQAEDDLSDFVNLQKKRVFKVFNKCDLYHGICEKMDNITNFAVSAKTGEGIQSLLSAIANTVEKGKIVDGEIMTNERQLNALERAYKSLCVAMDDYENLSSDCIVIELKNAWTALGEITGETVSEIIIDNIFDKFCVGK